VKEVANHTAADFLEVREDLPQQADFMHRKERFVNAFTVLHHFEDGPPALGLLARMPPLGSDPADRGERHGMKAGLLAMRLGKSSIMSNGSLKSDGNAIRLRLPPISSSHIDARVPPRLPAGVIAHHRFRGFT